MQVNTIHVQPHSVAAPKSLKLSLSVGNGSDTGMADARRRDSDRGVDSVDTYTELLREIPDVRSNVVEVARARLVSGDFLTAKAAQDAAHAVLQQT